MDCIFCKIIDGSIPSYKIYEDEKVLAFLDINPDYCGHTLVVPKKHYQDINDIPNDLLIYIFDIARKISNILIDKLHCDGISYTQNNGSIQEVKHFHLHIKPYYKGERNLSVEEVYNKINA